MADPIRYDRLQQYAQENRLDYNELCRVVRVAAAPAIKDSNRYRWLRDRPCLSVFTGESIRFRPFDCPHEIEVGQIGATDLDEAIDAQLTPGVPAVDPLRAGVQRIVTALRNREWADLLATDPDLLALEVEVGKLIGVRDAD